MNFRPLSSPAPRLALSALVVACGGARAPGRIAFGRRRGGGTGATALGSRSATARPGGAGDRDGSSGGRPAPVVIPGGSVTLGTPANPAAWGGAPMSSGAVPVIVYPSSETRFPRNIYRTLFQWRTQGIAQFRLSFAGPGARSPSTPTASTPMRGTRRRRLLGGRREGLVPHRRRQRRRERAGDASTASTRRRRRRPCAGAHHDRVLEAGRHGRHLLLVDDVRGHPARQHRRAEPEDYITGKPSTTYTNPADQVKCVACHVVSRDGKYMVAPVDATSGKSLWVDWR